ncbi:prepilin-type N-terminal cleavage/methylation domain-containing protein [Alkalihalobacillus sp. FSL W8-0930]
MGIKDQLKNQKGLTLIEVLASAAILIIVLGIGMAALGQSSVLTSKVQGESQDRQDVQVGLLELTNAVQSATELKELEDGTGFELFSNDTLFKTYWLVGNELKSESKDGHVQISGVQNMSFHANSGITLDIANLKEPVVLSTRGGIFQTELSDDVDNFKDIVCVRKDQVDGSTVKKEKDFSGYSQFENISLIPHESKKFSIVCDTTTGTISINDNVNVNLTEGSIRIITNNLKIDQNSSLTVSNGSISLPKSLPLSNTKMIPNSNVEIYHNSRMNSGGSLEIGGRFKSTGNSVSLTSNNNMIVSGDFIGNFMGTVESKGSIYVNGSLSTLNNQLKIISQKDIIVNKNMVLDFQSTMTSIDGSIYINGSVTNKNNETVIKSGANLFIAGTLENKFKSKIDTKGWVFINGNLNNPSNQPEIISGGDITVLGDVTNAEEAKLISDASIYISGNLISDQKFEFQSKNDIVVKGNVINTQNGKISLTKGSFFIGGKLHMDRLNIINVANNLYVQNGLHMVETTKLNVSNDSFVNGEIQLPTNSYSTEGAYFHTENSLTYTGPINGFQTNSSNFKVLNYNDNIQVSSIDTLSTFPSFPKTPVFPSELFK